MRIVIHFGSVFFLCTFLWSCEHKKNKPEPQQSPTEQDGGSPSSAGDAGEPAPAQTPSSEKSGADLVASQLQVDVQWTKGPVADDYSIAILTFTVDKNIPTTPVSGVVVTPWMKIHGHGTGDFQPEVNVDPAQANRFEVTDIYFIMSGPWELNVSAQWNNQTYKFEVPVNVP